MEVKTKIQQFTDLEVWRVAHDAVLDVYRITKRFPNDELFALVSQMRRCAVSITSNIAEGFGRRSHKEKAQFYAISQGSITELQNQLIIARDVDYISDEEFEHVNNKLIRAHKLATGLIKATKSWPKALAVLALLLFLPFSFFFLPSSAAARALPQPPNNLGLVGYWSMEDGRGSHATDFSGNGNTGVLTNFALATSTSNWTNGKVGKALDFDGSNDRIVINDSGDSSLDLGTSDFTISAWVKRGGLASSDYVSIFAKSPTSQQPDFAFWINANGGGALVLSVADGVTREGDSYTSTLSVTDLDWHFVAVSADRDGNVTYYLDGQTDTDDISGGSGVNLDSAEDATIGSERDTLHTYGIIDEVRVYDRALSTAELDSLYSRTGIAKVGRSPKTFMTEGLVAYHTFDAADVNTTTSTDISGQGNDGTLSGGPTVAIGKVGQALKFSGADQYVDILHDEVLDITGDIALSVWVRPASLAGTQPIITKGSGSGNYSFYFAMLSGGTPQLQLGGTSIAFSSTDALPLDQWSHVVATRSGSTATIYINGVAKGTDTGAEAIRTNTVNVNIGRYSPVSTEFNGSIDDVRIYNRALSASEAAALYRAGFSAHNANQNDKLTSGLLGFWSFNGKDLNTTTSTDVSGNGNDGTLSGNVRPTPGKVGQALKFDGNNDWISLGTGSASVPTTGVAVSAWIRITTSGTQMIIGKLGGGAAGPYYFRVQSPQNLRLNIVSTSGAVTHTTTGDKVTLNEWHHVVGTWDGSTMRIYLNGVELDSGVSQDGTMSNDAALDHRIGALSTDLQDFNGDMDEVRLYNRGLTADEVTQLYNMGR